MFVPFYHAPLAFSWPPSGERLKLPVMRDTLVSTYRNEKTGNNGAAKCLKVKGSQEFALFDIDASKLKEKIIAGARLHLFSATPHKAPLLRLGVSSIASTWSEGHEKGYRAQIGATCFNQAGYQRQDWAYRGSTLMDVIFGRGHTVWKFADCTVPDDQGWQTCAVAPDVVAARIAGLSHGFAISDEVGHVWSCKEGQFHYEVFPNRFFYSCEKQNVSPFMEIWIKGIDGLPPEPVNAIRVETDQLPTGEALVKWITPADRGIGKTLGFKVSYQKEGIWQKVPRYLIPMAGKTGAEVRMYLRDIAFLPGEQIKISIRPVDSAGNIGNAYIDTIQVSSGAAPLSISEAVLKPFAFNKALPTVANLKVAVIDLLDKVDPLTGNMIPSRKPGYKGGNHIFYGAQKLIRLQGARNETICFQLNLAGKAQDVSIQYGFDNHSELAPRIFQFAHVKVDRLIGTSFLPDPLLIFKGPCTIPAKVSKIGVPNQSNQSFVCELYIPHDEVPGIKHGKLKISVGSEQVGLDVVLTVWNFTLPNKLSFVPEMNAYAAGSKDIGYDYYRLAHEHRTCINQLPYSWSGMPSLAPEWNGKAFEWGKWDQNVGPLLDGTAFIDLPRKGEPVDVFYLPVCENWPVGIYDHYKPSFWVDEALSNKYKKNLHQTISAFAQHIEQSKWYKTIFQFYLNNKLYYRKNYKYSSAPWIFDEPVNIQDFWALRWYGLVWNRAVQPWKKKVKLWFRGDISYNQLGRNILWGIMDVEYIGGNTAQKMRMKQDENYLWRKSFFAEYGTANRIEMPNTQPVLWCLSAWAKGALGVLPWNTIGREKSWVIGEPTALFYPHSTGPKPSVRLKAFTRGQQDVEYLVLLGDVLKVPHAAIGEWLNKTIDLKQDIQKDNETDAGMLQFKQDNVIQLWKMRCRIGKMISDIGPGYKRALVSLESPKWDENHLPEIGYVSMAPKIKSTKPQCDRFRPLD